MTAKTLGDQWDEFESMTGVTLASATQRREMKRAFYAGAISLMDMVFRNLDADTDSVTAADYDFMANLRKEMDQYMRDLASGAA